MATNWKLEATGAVGRLVPASHSFVKKGSMIRCTQLLAFCLLIVGTSLGAQQPPKHNFKPVQGYVPDAATAIKIAVAVWEPIYGVKQIAKQKPFIAVLANGVWKVNGSMPKQLILGGVAEAEISKDDGKILRISHGR